MSGFQYSVYHKPLINAGGVYDLAIAYLAALPSLGTTERMEPLGPLLLHSRLADRF